MGIQTLKSLYISNTKVTVDLIQTLEYNIQMLTNKHYLSPSACHSGRRDSFILNTWETGTAG